MTDSDVHGMCLTMDFSNPTTVVRNMQKEALVFENLDKAMQLKKKKKAEELAKRREFIILENEEWKTMKRWKSFH